MMLREVREQTRRKEHSHNPDALRCSQHANKPLTRRRCWGGREERYLYLTRREQRKEAQSCSRQATQKRGHRAMGLWQEAGRGWEWGTVRKRSREKQVTVSFSLQTPWVNLLKHQRSHLMVLPANPPALNAAFQILPETRAAAQLLL